MFTIKKGRLYVKDSKFGGKSSYTTNPERAVKYTSYEEAKNHACGNEHVVPMSRIYA